MKEFSDMLWVETRKAIRSRMPLFTGIGALFMPLGIAFLVFVATNPDLSRKLGLVGAKANLMAYATTDWTAYMRALAQTIAAGGFFIFCFINSWVFGREFADHTVKDLLAVPVRRGSILLAKFAVTALWSAALAVEMLAVGLVGGALMGLPNGSAGALARGILAAGATAGLTIIVIPPFAFLAGVGRGYLLPIGAAILAIVMANLSAILGWGAYFPWAVPGLVAQDVSALTPASYLIAILTGAAGAFGAYLWWKYADQNR